MNYLRSGQFILENSIPIEAIKTEASYFGLVGLEEIVNQKLAETERSEKDSSDNDEFLLNVGGEVFVTTKETLCKYKGSRLSRGAVSPPSLGPQLAGPSRTEGPKIWSP